MTGSENGTDTAADIFDVVIVGGGFAGSAAATVLARAGHRIAVVDMHETFPMEYRAEKIGGQQLDQLRSLGLLDAILPLTTPVRGMVNMRRGVLVDRREVKEYGILYHDTVAALRAAVPKSVRWMIGKASDIETSGDLQKVTLADGRAVAGRLIVLATGVSEAIRKRLGVKRGVVQPNQCFTVGWTIAPPPGGKFQFPALTCYGEKPGDGVDYASFFPLGDNMRANFFMFTDPKNPIVAKFKADPMAATTSLMPGLAKMVRGCAVVDGPHLYSVDLYKCENVVQNGAVLIGDSFRTSCPAVGSGLTCALSDVERLAAYVGGWLATPGMGADKIAAYYADPAKVAMDEKAHALAFARRRAATDTSVKTVALRDMRFVARIVRDRLKHLGQPVEAFRAAS